MSPILRYVRFLHYDPNKTQRKKWSMENWEKGMFIKHNLQEMLKIASINFFTSIDTLNKIIEDFNQRV